MACAAQVGGIQPAIPAVAHAQPTPALAAHQQALQQRGAFACRSSRNHRRHAGAVLFQAQLIALELLPVNKPFMMIEQEHPPL